MPSSFLGMAISGLVAFIFLLVGVIGLVGKKSLGGSVRSVLGMIPIGNPKLWAAILLIFGFAFGGLTYGLSAGQSLFSGVGLGTASGLTGSDVKGVSAATVDCTFSGVSATTAAGVANISIRSDPNNLKVKYADVKESGGSYSIAGNLSCNRITNDIRQGQQVGCQIVGDTFRSETSTTDSNTYYIVATSTSASKIKGLSWAQTAYLQDNAGASTTSDQEITKLTFAQDEVNQKLGFLFTLPGNTPFGYLNNQSSNNVVISCGDQTVGTIVVTKVAGTA